MPEFIRPRRAIIETGGGFGDLLGPLILFGALALAIGAVVLFITAHLVLIAVTAAVLMTAGTAGVIFLRRYMMVVHEPPPQPALPLAAQASLTAPPGRAIAPVVHHHVHLHGVTPDDVAAIMRQQAEPARPAIQETPWPSPSSSSLS